MLCYCCSESLCSILHLQVLTLSNKTMYILNFHIYPHKNKYQNIRCCIYHEEFKAQFFQYGKSLIFKLFLLYFCIPFKNSTILSSLYMHRLVWCRTDQMYFITKFGKHHTIIEHIYQIPTTCKIIKTYL